MMRKLMLIIVFLLCTPIVHAAQIVKVKGKSALVDLQGDPAVVGDMFFALSADGKRRGILKITKVQGKRAIARIAKGKATTGMSLEYRAAKVSGSKSSGGYSSGGTTSTISTKRSYWGAIAGLTMNTVSVKVADPNGAARGTAAMSGMGYGLKGLFDYQLFPQIWFRGTAGLEGFNAAGGTICGVIGNENCKITVNYISFDFVGRYVFGQKTVRPWAGGGAELLFPMSKESNAIASASIGTTSVFLVAGGIDWFISPTMYIPISLEYGMLPKSKEVTATWIAGRVGVAVPW